MRPIFIILRFKKVHGKIMIFVRLAQFFAGKTAASKFVKCNMNLAKHLCTKGFCETEKLFHCFFTFSANNRRNTANR